MKNNKNKRVNILFIESVYASKCDEFEIINEKFNENVDTLENKEESLWDVPVFKFTGLDSWPKNINLLCNVCSMKCDNIYISIPIYIDRPKLGFKYNMTMKYVFNSWYCAAYFILNNFDEDKIDGLNSNLLLFYNIINSSDRKYNIIPCNSPYLMEQYGGKYKPEKWMEDNKNKDIQIVEQMSDFYLV